MSKSYKNHLEYAQDLSAILDAALAKQRDLKFEAAYFLFSFVMRDFQAKVTGASAPGNAMSFRRCAR